MEESNRIIDKAVFRKKVEKLSNLPTLPNLLDKFTDMIKDPKVSMAAFGKELSKDQILTSKLLKLVNSAFYGFPGRISTVTHALVLLGYDALKGLIVSCNVFESLPPEAYPLWRHSVATSLASRAVAQELALLDIEEFAVAGLLHDIGKVIFYLETPEEYRTVVNATQKSGQTIWRTEREILGFDHADIGVWICEKWNLPVKLAAPIGYHHHVSEANEHKLRAAVISAADILVRGIGVEAEEGLILEEVDSLIEELVPLTLTQIRKIINILVPEVESLKHLAPEDMK